MPRTILLADDSVTIQKVVELTFLDEDFRVVSFANGSDAIARLAELRPDVVLADVHMPGADGYELCAAARETLPGVPVLLLVGTFEVFDPQRAAEVGAAGHIKKPFDSQELLRRVQEMVTGAAAEPPAAWAAEPLAAPALDELPPIDFDASPAATVAPAGDSWSFEPVSEAPPESGEVAADTWGGVIPESDAAASAEPADEPVWEPVAEPMATAPAMVAGNGMPLSDDDVDRIARRVVELIGEKAVRDVAWEVVPDLAELLLKARIRELEASVE
jgi:CheY-like chemotaxis protein